MKVSFMFFDGFNYGDDFVFSLKLLKSPAQGLQTRSGVQGYRYNKRAF
jgi:hypothetical protein